MQVSKDHSRLVLDFIKLLRQNSWTCGFAESCTGGLLSSWITRVPGVSQQFCGSIVSYSNAVKREVLQVRESTLNNTGAVSEQTVKEMLQGVLKILKVDVAAAITGIAGPSGGTVEKPIGLVFIAVHGPGFEEIQRLDLKGNRESIQSQSCEQTLRLLISCFESLRKD